MCILPLSVYLLDFKDIRDYSLNTGAVEDQTMSVFRVHFQYGSEIQDFTTAEAVLGVDLLVTFERPSEVW